MRVLWKRAIIGWLGIFLLGCCLPLWSQEKPKATKPAAVKKSATLLLRVPPDARVEIDNIATKQRGEFREFVTPPLAPGKYVYTIKVILSSGGAESTRMRQVRIEPGKKITVDLRPGKDTESSEIIFVPTPYSVVDEMLKMAGVTKKDVVYDLGCGDGRIVIMAAKKHGARGVGIDIDPVRVKEAKELAKKEGVENLVEIRQGDALNVPDISKATVITTYMLPEFMNRLEPGLKKHLKPGTRIVAHDYPLPNWKPTEEKTVRSENWEHRLYLWIVGP